MLRYLTERLPVDGDAELGAATGSSRSRSATCCATWSAAPTLPADVNRAFDIGGPDVLTYERDDAAVRRRSPACARRIIVPVPVLTPRLSAHWVGLVTPVPSAIARPLVEPGATRSSAASTTSPTYVPDPPDGLIGFDEAVGWRCSRIRDADGGDPLVAAPLARRAERPAADRPGLVRRHALRRRARAARSTPPRRTLWRVIEGIGGENGWYSFPLAWSVRGWLDRLVGGVGLRRGRRDPRPAVRRRGAGLLAGRGDRRPAAAAAARRDAAAGRRLARAEGGGRRRAARCSGSGRCSTRAGWPGTRTGGRSAVPRHRLRRDAAQHRPRRRAGLGRRRAAARGPEDAASPGWAT